MTWPVYSERLLVANPGGATSVAVTVPAGRRMIVTELAFTNSGATAGQVVIYLAGVWYFDHKFLVAERAFFQPNRGVLYAGEQLGAEKEFASLGVIACGYLFEDPSGATDAPLEHDRGLSTLWRESIDPLPS